ncbi:2-phosphosulfolactate phosphatase [Pseudalkalibacillus decolorationis]|uniref:2-phosphosulfolactate phosphatase n=1 Tax=Pseudalkalibacillus decolorationis TaxID=163879 RepID=UPI0021477701|nr:2-phosphosulfolactate phosphatase [Pseudalkalibacillus decolorationis]
MKIHLLLKKEDIDKEKMKDNKVAVVFDILLATSTITAALDFGAKEIIPVLNGEEAQKEAFGRSEGSYVLVGEYGGRTIEGFLSPNPMDLKEKVNGKTVILSTTNGTVAIKNSAEAKAVYVASLLNSQTVAEHILKSYEDETIVLVCSGSSGEFNVEDFFGAGYFIDCIASQPNMELELTDSAMAAHRFFTGNRKENTKILRESQIGKMLLRYGYDKEIDFVANYSIFQVITRLENGKTLGSEGSLVKKVGGE